MKKPVLFDTLIDTSLTELLISGAIGIMPTDTQYGLIASIKHPEAIRRLYDLKGRENRPGTLLAADTDQLHALGIDQSHTEPAGRHWPGPVSVVMPAGDNLAYLHLGMNSLAVRIPDDEQLIQVLSQVGVLQTSSANPTGREPASSIAQAQQYFGDSVDFYVDGGDKSGSQPSTVITHTNGEIRILRQGAGRVSA